MMNDDDNDGDDDGCVDEDDDDDKYLLFFLLFKLFGKIFVESKIKMDWWCLLCVLNMINNAIHELSCRLLINLMLDWLDKTYF